MNNQDQILESIQQQSGGQVARGAVGTFERVKKYSEELSAQAGEKVDIFHDVCHIRVPGNKNADHKELVQKHYPDGRVILVGDHPIKRFPLAWDAFLRGEDLRPEGTMLSDCDAIPKERVLALKAAQIKTVEELAALPDRSLQRIGMDARALQKAAQKWLDEHDDQAKMAIEFDELKAKVAAMEAAGNGDSKNDTPKRSSKRGNNSTE